MFKAILISLAAGGVATSFAEFFFKYNLVDLVKDKTLAAYHAIRGK
jgi:hypothetical protein